VNRYAKRIGTVSDGWQFLGFDDFQASGALVSSLGGVWNALVSRSVGRCIVLVQMRWVVAWRWLV